MPVPSQDHCGYQFAVCLMDFDLFGNCVIYFISKLTIGCISVVQINRFLNKCFWSKCNINMRSSELGTITNTSLFKYEVI